MTALISILPSLLFALLFARALPTGPVADPNEIQQILKDVAENRRTVGIVLGIVDADGNRVFSYGKTARNG